MAVTLKFAVTRAAPIQSSGWTVIQDLKLKINKLKINIENKLAMKAILVCNPVRTNPQIVYFDFCGFTHKSSNTNKRKRRKKRLTYDSSSLPSAAEKTGAHPYHGC
jgi:hypothetical protein